jgi:hypothetical protein
MSEMSAAQDPGPGGPAPKSLAAKDSVPESPDESRPSESATHSRSRLRKILTPLILSILGLVLLAVAAVLYPRSTEISAPAYPQVVVFTKFGITSINYRIAQVSPATAEIFITADRPLPGPRASTQPANVTVNLPPGITFRNCTCDLGVFGSYAIGPLTFNHLGDASVAFFVKASSFGVTFNGVNAYAAIPEISYSGPGQPEFYIQYGIPSADSYDWSAFPTAFITNSLVIWKETLSSVSPSGLVTATDGTPGRVAVGINHGGESSDDNKTFLAGILAGLAGAAILSAIQEALHALD